MLQENGANCKCSFATAKFPPTCYISCLSFVCQLAYSRFLLAIDYVDCSVVVSITKTMFGYNGVFVFRERFDEEGTVQRGVGMLQPSDRKGPDECCVLFKQVGNIGELKIILCYNQSDLDRGMYNPRIRI